MSVLISFHSIALILSARRMKSVNLMWIRPSMSADANTPSWSETSTTVL